MPSTSTKHSKSQAAPCVLSTSSASAKEGHIVGLCGNWAVVTRAWPEWFHIFSFIGPMLMSKPDFLKQLSTYIPAEEHVMVGNILGVSGQSDDQGAAIAAGWRFIRESDFASGVR